MRRGALLCLVLVTMVSACAGGTSDRRELLVSAAASLTDAFGDIESAFEDEHPDVDVVVNLGGSSALREQILAGAPVDVFASANVANMDKVIAGDLVESGPTAFATNQLQIAVPVDNPGGVVGLADFANPDLLIGLCAEAVPCGDFARQALELAAIEAVPDTNEPDVRALLTKIEVGELDAAIVYSTDVAARPRLVVGIDIPAQFNVIAEYPIAVLNDGDHGIDGAAFVGFVLSAQGQAILRQHGFSTP
ncbi:MAG: molybdate ABC transporter substrate-binding protein [Acidimicrobiia bacterium]|nr:molybdate ABC transporter substrate-binding protein [Acidimicrobiia bacterium]MDX2466832.1 molybdate ABC transporter substrate-binding protein [Acidimicrobiia bacterium]